MASTMEVKVEFLTRVLEDVEAGLANSSQEIEDLRAKVACLRRIVGALDQQRVMFAESYQEFSSAFLRLRLAPLKMGGLHDPDLSSRYAAFPEAAREAGLFGHKELKYSSYGKCCECPYLEHCSVCPMSIAYLPGNTDPHRVPDFVCAFNRVALEHRDRFWAYLGDRLLDLETIGGFEWRFSLGGRLRES